MLSCSALKNIVFISSFFLTLGGGLIFLAPITDPSRGEITLIVNAVGIGSILIAAALLVGTTVLALLPASRRNLEACNH